MTPTYHTHLWVEFTDAANPDLNTAGPIDLLSVSDNASLGGTQSLHLTVAGRTRDGRMWRELLNVGDVFRVGAHRHSNDGTAQHTIIEDAIVSDYQVSEQMSPGQYSYTLSIAASGLQGVLEADAVAWWMFYGTVEGALRSRGALLPDDTSGRLDKVLANYANRVAFHGANWERAGTGLRERMGYHLRSLSPNVPILYNLSVAEGAHWQIMASAAELDLHEFFVQQRSEGDDRGFTGGFVHHPTVNASSILSSADAGQGDGTRPYIILRPKPFPYADRNGKPVMTDWNALPLHDLTDRRASTGSHGFGHSVSAVRNFFMVYPGYDAMNDSMAFTLGLAVVNRASISRHAYRPAKFKTSLVLNDGDEGSMIDLARDLTWRMAGQMNRMDQYSQGSITVPLAPEVQAGDRVRFRLVNTDESSQGIFQGYVTSRAHQWQLGGGATTSLSLERVLPESTYQTPEWFVEGLELAEVNWPAPAHRNS
ncbi:late control protein [Deinococcus sp. 23YEL01]|uniref:late control protein n=1 Tax=Deinococcus sp. 23YEL01 TaxID=2745871 RepID=UPI001E5C8063|nr:late control protein [Deinococcus sp. 23YEL01]MCD0168081.1 late control protein [Deinococcus sp. 23YEL01]